MCFAKDSHTAVPCVNRCPHHLLRLLLRPLQLLRLRLQVLLGETMERRVQHLAINRPSPAAAAVAAAAATFFCCCIERDHRRVEYHPFLLLSECEEEEEEEERRRRRRRRSRVWSALNTDNRQWSSGQ